jgi:ferredoxin
VPKVEFEREGIVAEARPGQSLLDVAEDAGVELFRGIWPGLHCGRRRGWCNRCKVWVRSQSEGAVNPPTGKEQARLRLNGRITGTMRLACQVEVRGDVQVHTRAGGPGQSPSLAGGAPAWRNAMSARAAEKKAEAAAAEAVAAAPAAPAAPAPAAPATSDKPEGT